MTVNEEESVLKSMMETIETLRTDQLKLSEKFERLTMASSNPPPISISPSTSFNLPASSETSDPTKTNNMYPARVILTTYPNQHGIQPIPLTWGSSDAKSRGPVVASRHADSIKKRNSIGSYGGSYCIYRALAVAIGDLPFNHRPDFHMTEPTFDIRPNPSWFDPEKIVSLDPFGHTAPQVFKEEYDRGLDIRPTIAVTRAHMTMAEMEMSVKNGGLTVDGKIVVNQRGDLAVSKAAVEPVWYLPGVAKRFGIEEGLLRRALFEDTGGMYPELITRPDLKVYLPPIGGISIYVFGNPDFISDKSKKLTLRVHDECNGSDVFGSDICTCRPYLIYGIEECVKQAQQGGVGVIVYFRKEGRALGEVTKYLVYNARKRQTGGDTASNYFLRTECIAGVKDMRFQALMPDVLHWLGIQKIDRMMSMSNMKHDAIVESGIPILERVPIPENLIPEDSRVEIDAKIASGYFTTGSILNENELAQVKGRDWEDVEH
ncbi:GTP cyclohydrolase N terminal-domain-containing protein [Sporodiniella umbellata]|nr:GTP cyclohydrolase N terminal-domain-containing protein [Sporodiniella umbellata]